MSTSKNQHTEPIVERVDSPFDFYATVLSHGWVALSPFHWDDAAGELQRPIELSTGCVVRLTLRASESRGGEVRGTVEAESALTEIELVEARQAARRMLRLDEDLSKLYRLQKARGGRPPRLKPGGGRLLRCPTLFEDMVCTLCTTNISWSGTRRMVANLVEALGAPFPMEPDQRAFPTPDRIAAKSSKFLKEEVRLGYRSEYVWELAQAVQTGDLDLEALQSPELSTVALREALLSVRGVGPYAAATLLMLLGRYDELAIDSAMRDFVAQTHFDGSTPTDAQIREIYEPWGTWKYLAYWFDG